MPRLRSALLITTALVANGCAMEQYHYPQTQENVPVAAVVAFSEKYPNDTIKSIAEQKMLDGTVKYTFVSTSKNNVEHTTAISADGKTVANVI